MINNSIEAIPDKGKVLISIDSISDEFFNVTVEDNGKGIPSDVLSKLGEKGFSFGKQTSGAGLGVYHAKKTIEAFGGSFNVSSLIGKGTLITLSLPRSEPPSWFLERLNISDETQIAILDDDLSFHQIWAERLGKNAKLRHFSSTDEFSDFVRSNGSNNFLYLIDYNLSGHATGIEVIKGLNISGSSILVTSKFDDSLVKQEASLLNIKIIPKEFAGFIPITFTESDLELYESILIDDDRWIRAGWERRAKEVGIKFKAFEAPDLMRGMLNKIDKENTSIFIDSNLGSDQVAGEFFASILRDEGFKKLILVTGYKQDDFNKYPWLQVEDKQCPFGVNI